MPDLIRIPNSAASGVFMRRVKHSGDPVPLPTEARNSRVRQVWLVLNESAIRSAGLLHRHNAVQEEQLADWVVQGGSLRYFGHATSQGEVCDLLLVLSA